jgi:hypothetical protein
MSGPNSNVRLRLTGTENFSVRAADAEGRLWPELGEQRRDIRIIVSVSGRYSLDRRNRRGERREYACRAINISPSAIALCAPVIGTTGERVFACIDHFGKLRGTVGRLLDRGFVMNIIASDDERDSRA